jgi:hypothetical protein
VCSSLRLLLGLSRGKVANIEDDTRRRGDNITGDSGHAANDAAGGHSVASMSLHITGCLALLFAMSACETIGAADKDTFGSAVLFFAAALVAAILR